MHPILEPGLALLRQAAEVVRCPAGIPTTQAAAGCEGILSLVVDPIGEDVLSVPGLRIVSNCGVGFENINVAAATRHGVMATNTPGVLDQTTADLAFAVSGRPTSSIPRCCLRC